MYVATAIASKVSISATLRDSKPRSKLSNGFFNSPIHTFPCSELPKSLLYIQQQCFISVIHLYSDQYEVVVIFRKKDNLYNAFSAVLPRFSNHKTRSFLHLLLIGFDDNQINFARTVVACEHNTTW